MSKTCVVCDREFQGRPGKQYCSGTCRARQSRAKQKLLEEARRQRIRAWWQTPAFFDALLMAIAAGGYITPFLAELAVPHGKKLPDNTRVIRALKRDPELYRRYAEAQKQRHRLALQRREEVRARAEQAYRARHKERLRERHRLKAQRERADPLFHQHAQLRKYARENWRANNDAPLKEYYRRYGVEMPRTLYGAYYARHNIDPGDA